MSRYNGMTSKNNPDHKIYMLWQNMLNRCFNKKVRSFKNYGARGITVCEEWSSDFIAFFNWVKENGYNESLQLDRIENDGNYEPSNCQFVTALENTRSWKRRKYVSNKSGYVGVSISIDGKYISSINVNYKKHFLGKFDNVKDAVLARIEKEIELFGEQKTSLRMAI